MKIENYIKSETFEGFKQNQDKLINVLNHNMTILTTDVKWLKRLSSWQIGFLATIAATVLVGFIKLVFLN